MPPVNAASFIHLIEISACGITDILRTGRLHAGEIGGLSDQNFRFRYTLCKRGRYAIETDETDETDKITAIAAANNKASRVLKRADVNNGVVARYPLKKQC